MDIKAVLFDLDDTLYGEFPQCNRAGFAAADAYAAEVLGLPEGVFGQRMEQARRALAQQLPGTPESHDRVLYAKHALEALGISPIRHAEPIAQVYWKAVLDRMQVRPGVPELLDALRARGIQVVVCTNMLADVQMRKLCRLGLDARVDHLVTSEDAGADKPAFPIFAQSLARAGCTAAQAIMVGDSFRHDVLGAHMAGIESVWLHIGTDTATPVDGLRCYEAASFADAARWIWARVCG